MAKKKQQKLPKQKISLLRGLRRAEAVDRQLGRWLERWPLASNAAEWLRFAHALQATARLLEADAFKRVNPAAFAAPKSRMEAARSAQQEALKINPNRFTDKRCHTLGCPDEEAES